MVVRIPNFSPRGYQLPVLRHMEPKEFGGDGGDRAMLVWHRRGGKDLTCAHHTCKAAHWRKAAYWHVFPSLEQGRKAIWEGFTRDGERIMEQVFPAAIRARPKAFLPNAECVVELKNGSIWRLMGSDHMEVVGAGPAGVVFSEFGLARPKTWDLVRPMLAENNGWAIFNTTPRGKNHAYQLWEMARKNPKWFAQLLTIHDTHVLPADILEQERRAGMPEPLVRQEYLCDWTAANVGSVWGDLLELLETRGGIGDFEHATDGLFTTLDLGIGDSTAIWVWALNGFGGVDFVDHHEAHGKPLSYYFDLLDLWEREKGYRYAKHWLPHDARARTLATGVSILDQFLQWKPGKVAIGPSLSLADGIQAMRWLLQQPTRFHARTAEGLEALKQYHYAYDEDRKTFTSKPEHDWSSHSSDAARYVACVAKASKGLVKKLAENRRPEGMGGTVDGKTEATLDELFELKERMRGER